MSGTDRNSPGPSNKRARTDSDVSPSILDVSHLERADPWFDDGNVVITTATKMYRVYRGILIQQSEIFSDMFGISPPPNQDTVEGCPTVYLHDDPEDVHHFLKALFQRGYCANPQEQLEFPIVRALLRLGTKYHVQLLRIEAILRLSRDFPSSLGEFDQTNGPTAIIGYNALPIDVINLARQHNVSCVLPAAIYQHCFTHTLKSVFDGIRRPDGSMAVLSPENQRECVLARRELLDVQARISLRWLFNTNICNNIECLRSRQRITADFVRPEQTPLIVLRRTMEFIDTFNRLCHICKIHATQSQVQTRSQIWALLPSLFNLPPWNELQSE